MKKNISLYVILLTTFIDWMGIGLVYPMFTSMLYQPDSGMFSLDNSELARAALLGILLSATSIAEFIFAPILGAFSDNHGRKKVIIASLCCGIIGYSLSVFAVKIMSIWLLLVSRLIAGMASANAGVAGAAIADISTQDEKAKNFTLYSMMCGIGFALGPFFGGILSEIDYSVPFCFTAILTTINVLLVIRFLPETHTPVEKVSWRDSFGFANIKKAFLYPQLRAVFLSVFMVIFGWSLYWEFMPVTQIKEFGFTAHDVANMFAYGASFFVLSSALFTRFVVARFGEVRAFSYSMFFLSLFIFALFIHGDPRMLWFYVPLQQFWLSIFYPTSTTLVSSMSDKAIQGEVLGINTSIQSFSFMLAPILGGLMLSLHSTIPLLVGASCILLGACLFRSKIAAVESKIQET